MTIPSAKKLVAAICLTIGLVVPGVASAHPGGDGTFHVPEPPQNLRVTGIAGNDSNVAVVSWETGHSHPNTPFAQSGYLLSITAQVPEGETQSRECMVSYVLRTQSSVCLRNLFCCGYVRNRPRTCPVRLSCPVNCPYVEQTLTRNPCEVSGLISIPNKSTHTEVVTGLTPDTTYYVTVSARYGGTHTGGVTERVAIFGTDIPNPVTPTDPETPPPSGCTYSHTLTGAPAATANAYTSRILITTREPDATATISAYQADNGHPIDVLDSEGNALFGPVSLAPARSVKRFQMEEIQGWHSVIVEHPSERAMKRATVVMRLREPDGGVSIVPAQGVSDCESTRTNTE